MKVDTNAYYRVVRCRSRSGTAAEKRLFALHCLWRDLGYGKYVLMDSSLCWFHVPWAGTSSTFQSKQSPSQRDLALKQKLRPPPFHPGMRCIHPNRSVYRSFLRDDRDQRHITGYFLHHRHFRERRFFPVRWKNWIEPGIHGYIYISDGCDTCTLQECVCVKITVIKCVRVLFLA